MRLSLGARIALAGFVANVLAVVVWCVAAPFIPNPTK
jgi:hypothetical protein